MHPLPQACQDANAVFTAAVAYLLDHPKDHKGAGEPI